jgi:hypothetical protein
MPNDNAVHRVCLMLGQLDVTIFFVVGVSQREERNLGMLIMSNTVNKKKQGRQPTRMLARDGIHHMHRMHNCIKPEGTRHLLFGEVGASNMNHHLPMQLDEFVGQLVLCRSSDNLGLAINEIFADRQTKNFQVTVGVKATCQQTSRSPEEAKSRDDVSRRESLETKQPIVMCGLVSKDVSITKSANGDTVAEHSIHVQWHQDSGISYNPELLLFWPLEW